MEIVNLDILNLPEGLEIFIITMTCKMNTNFYIDNILNFYPLTDNNIKTIKSKNKIRNLNNTIKIKEKSNISFYNQITIIMKINIPSCNKNINFKYVNIKLFNNGSIQISGLQSIEHCNITLQKLLSILKGDFGYIENNKIHEIRFLESDNVNIIDTKINMINTMFEYESKINRNQLYNRLLNINLGITIKYQPEIHAPVHLKLDVGNKKPVTIFIFESGKILIMGSRNKDNIIYSYNFISKLLYDNHDYIIKKNLYKIVFEDEDLKKLIDLKSLQEVINEY
jgi:TATA-box binding protein (TBP) (component of TFIID and TFIIIB)